MKSASLSQDEGSVEIEVADLGSEQVLPDSSTVLGPPDGRPDIVVANSGLVVGIGTRGGPEIAVLPAKLDDAGELEFECPVRAFEF